MRVVIGVAGTAKNTGKTTTLLAITKFFHSKGKNIFLTSIGYDGEDFDNITGLPKPRIFVPAGAMAASALSLLQSSDAEFKDLKYTGVNCALGPVFVGIAGTSGKVVLAGPTNAADLVSVIDFSPENSAVLLDGAFSRLSPMVAADSLVLATGAARNEDPRKVAREINAIYRVMSLPEVPHQNCGDQAVAMGEEVLRISGGLFLPGQGRKMLRDLDLSRTYKVLHVEGIVNPSVFLEVLDALGVSKHTLSESRSPVLFVFDHPIMLLLSGNVILWERVLDQISRMGFGVCVRKSINFLGVTINPYTLSQLENGKYEAGQVEPREFLDEVRKHTQAPCTDIVLEGPHILYSWLETLM